MRFYGDSMQNVLSRYLEQSIVTFLEQQELYQRRMRDVLNASPLKLMQRLADQNINFLRSLLPGSMGSVSTDPETPKPNPTAAPTDRIPTSEPAPADSASQTNIR